MLSSDSVHVWRIRLDICGDSSQFPARFEAWRAVLSLEERRRAEAFRGENDRRQYVMTHAVLRILLGGFLDVAPAAIAIVGEGGSKPALGIGIAPERSDVRFNLSHTRGAALIGVAVGREVGVDVEQKRPMEDLQGLARSVMSEDELEYWQALAPESRLDAFYRVWTRKEAYLKAIGLGLFRNLQEVTVPVMVTASTGDADLEGAWKVRDSGGQEVWTVREISAWDGYSASVCWAGTDAVQVVTHDFDLMEM